jgi:hypothetical protein
MDSDELKKQTPVHNKDKIIEIYENNHDFNVGSDELKKLIEH